MIKTFYLFSTLAIIMITTISAITNAGGSPGGKTASPADGQSCTQCHTGTAVAVSSWISTNIPTNGYIPGNTYTITVTGTHTGVSRFGFELTAEDSLNNKVGTFIITNSGETKLVNSNHAITQTGNGLTPTNDSKTWTVDWIAPSEPTGTVTFYAALNAANGNMGTSGDIIYTTSTTVAKSSNIGIEKSQTVEYLKLFPSNTEDYVYLEWNNIKVSQLIVYNINGQQVQQQYIGNGQTKLRMDASSLAKGSYFVYIQTDNDILVKRFIKK